jgi:hypothetical protein
MSPAAPAEAVDVFERPLRCVYTYNGLTGSARRAPWTRPRKQPRSRSGRKS